MNITEIIKTNPNITFNIGSEELKTFANNIVKQTLEATKQPPPPQQSEIFLTGKEVDQKLKISRVTRHQWEKKGILQFIRIGNLKRYKLSDIENIGK